MKDDENRPFYYEEKFDKKQIFNQLIGSKSLIKEGEANKYLQIIANCEDVNSSDELEQDSKAKEKVDKNEKNFQTFVEDDLYKSLNTFENRKSIKHK